tara:strand:+ start:163 stop:465 length:303 start_codon:yes stop_codon:yes gene_type:complete
LYFFCLIIKVALDIETVFKPEWLYGIVAVPVESSIELFATPIVDHRYSSRVRQSEMRALSRCRVVVVTASVSGIVKNCLTADLTPRDLLGRSSSGRSDNN